jgi:hypothetical protein
MPSGRLAGCREEVGVRRLVQTRTDVYVLLKIIYIVWIVVRKVDPYYGKYKSVLAN